MVITKGLLLIKLYVLLKLEWCCTTSAHFPYFYKFYTNLYLKLCSDNLLGYVSNGTYS